MISVNSTFRTPEGKGEKPIPFLCILFEIRGTTAVGKREGERSKSSHSYSRACRGQRKRRRKSAYILLSIARTQPPRTHGEEEGEGDSLMENNDHSTPSICGAPRKKTKKEGPESPTSWKKSTQGDEAAWRILVDIEEEKEKRMTSCISYRECCGKEKKEKKKAPAPVLFGSRKKGRRGRENESL